MRVFSFFLISVVMFSCSNEDENNYTIENNQSAESELAGDFDFNNYTWLNGSFADTTSVKKEQTHEIWSFTEDSISSIGFYIRDGKRTTPDRSVIKQKKGSIYFSNTSSKNKSVEFKLIEYSNDSLFFKNPAHQYPQEVTYKKINDDLFHIIMNGFVHQQHRKIIFKMARYE